MNPFFEISDDYSLKKNNDFLRLMQKILHSLSDEQFPMLSEQLNPSNHQSLPAPLSNLQRLLNFPHPVIRNLSQLYLTVIALNNYGFNSKTFITDLSEKKSCVLLDIELTRENISPVSFLLPLLVSTLPNFATHLILNLGCSWLLKSEGWEKIFKKISTTITSVTIYEKHVETDCAQELLPALKTIPVSVKTIHLFWIKLDTLQQRDLKKSFQFWPKNITNLLIFDNFTKLDFIATLPCTLSFLSLGNILSQDHLIDEIIIALKNLTPNIQSLSLANCGLHLLKDKLILILPFLNHVNYLNLRNNRLSVPKENFLNALKNLSLSVRHLDLSSNHLSFFNTKEFTEAIPPSLLSINLTENGLNKEAQQLIQKKLENNIRAYALKKPHSGLKYFALWSIWSKAKNENCETKEIESLKKLLKDYNLEEIDDLSEETSKFGVTF